MNSFLNRITSYWYFDCSTRYLNLFKTTNEVLYGRAGYLSLLAFVKSTFENDADQVDNIIASYPSTLTGSNLSLGSTIWYVVESILNDGIRNGKNINGKFVMKWEWYNTEYLAKVFTNSVANIWTKMFNIRRIC